MEYKSLYLVIVGIIGAIFWALNYWNIFKKPQLFLPGNKKKDNGFYDFKKILVFIIGIIGWLYLTYSLTQPRKPLKFSDDEIEINDIIFVVDVSRSMLADDFKPNRLEVTKEKLLDFIKLRPKDRIGIITFSEKAFTLLPLTTDLRLIDRVVDEISVGFLGSGTNIGDALGLGVARAVQSPSKNKVIILMTDGVSNVGNLTPMQAAEMAKDKKIKVYTIGVGGDKDARIPVGQGIFGMQYQMIPGGSIDVENLKSIAETTNGKFYLAKDEGALSDVLMEIEKLEKTKIKINLKVVYEELFYKFLFIGVILILLGDFLRMFWLREHL